MAILAQGNALRLKHVRMVAEQVTCSTAFGVSPLCALRCLPLCHGVARAGCGNDQEYDGRAAGVDAIAAASEHAVHQRVGHRPRAEQQA